MALSERLELLITANGSAAVREFGRVGDAADRELKKTQGSLDRTASTMTSVGTKMIGVGAILVAGFGMAAKASEEANLAHLKLQNTIDKMPKLAGESTDAFEEQATALAKVTKYDDDATIAMQAMLGTFNVTGDEIREITPLVQDFASKFGVDLVTASKSVGKALMGQIGALQKQGVTIDKAAYATDRFAAVTEALRQQAGGFAEKEGQTFTGQLEIMKNSLEEISEGVGVGAVKAFNTLLGPVKSLSEGFANLDPGVQSVVGQVGTFAAVGLIAAGTASTLIGHAIKMRENFAHVATGAKDMWASLKANPGAIAGMAAAAGALYLLTQRMQDNQKQADKYVETNLAGAKSDTDRIHKLKEMRDALEKMQGPSQDFLGAHLYATEAGRKHADQLDAVNAELEKYEAETEAASGATTEYAAAMENLSSTIKAAFDPQFALLDAQQRLNEAQQSGTATAEDLARAAMGVDVATRELAAAMDEGSVSVAQTRATLDSWVRSGYVTAAQAAAIAAELGMVSAGADRLNGRVISVHLRLISEGQAALVDRLEGLGVVKRAQGGPVHRGQSYIVGDRRGMDTAEVFTPATDGFISPSGNGGSQRAGDTYVYVGGQQVAAVVTSTQRYDARGRR